jgi:hypothetical protein
LRSLEIGLNELEPFIRHGAHLQTGKPFQQLGGMRSREVLANWLLCAVLNHALGSDQLTFSSDPLGGDGIIYDGATGGTWQTEHVMVPKLRNGQTADAERLIHAAIEHKWRKGEVYASAKNLIVFLDAGAGKWFPNRVARKLPEPLHFDSVWVVSLQAAEDGKYVYAVTSLDTSVGNAPTWIVRISKDFAAWEVQCIQ